MSSRPTMDSGVEFRLATEILGTMPHAFYRAIEETVFETLHQGLYGSQVTGCTVTLTHTGYESESSTGWDFRGLTPLVLIDALKQAGTVVYEPVNHFHLEIPETALGSMLPVLARLGAVPESPSIRDSVCVLDGEAPAARSHELQQQLPALTRGEGVLELSFERYAPVRGSIPARPRSDHNPLNRKEYLLHVLRRV